jgi:hypothetical protein
VILREYFDLGLYHQACTRLIRADYCGDGTPWTVNGRRINVYDHLGIQYDSEKWIFEAEWDVNGARCLQAQRVRDMQTAGESPRQCIVKKAQTKCGLPSNFNSGTLLMNEFESVLKISANSTN